MSDTIDAVVLTGTSYQSCTALSGIPAGTAISIQNQTTDYVYAVISSTQPATDFVGEIIPPSVSDKAYVSAGENSVWLKGVGPVSIQEV